MASTINLVCLFFLITNLLLSSTQTHARDSHFFSKVSRNRDGASTPNQNYYDNNQENVAKSTPIQQEKEEPMFIPQTTQSGYGLYGHESGLDTPSNMDDTKYENQNNFNNNNNYDNFEKYREERNYVPKVQGFSETSYTNNYKVPNYNNDNVVVPRNYVGENNYNNNNNNDKGEYVVENNYNNNNKKKKNGVEEKQGISDTRYLENGKYFYDINDEKKFDRTNNNEFSYNSNLKNDNYNDFDNNNLSNNNYYNGKGIYPGYQSKFPKEEEFDFDDQP